MPRRFVPSDEQRRKVKSMAGYGLKQEQIAILIGVASTVTLRKYFREELTRGPIEAKAQVRKTLYKLATSGHHPGATMYWLKTRAGWSEQGKTPEPVRERPERHRWIVSVFQPPRDPDMDRLLAETLQETASSDPEWEDWEDAAHTLSRTYRAPPPG
jgi:hypothetical protein